MKVLVAGATGSVGSRLVPQLVERGHEVVGTSRSASSADRLRALGATPMVLDVLDPGATRDVVTDTMPDAIVHEATALAGKNDLRHFDESFAGTNRLRTDGTDNLIAAAREAGVSRLVAQSYAGWPYAREGGPVKSEDDPLDPSPVPEMRETLDAIEHLERRVTDAGGTVLRYGGLYGAPDDVQVELVRKRRFPIVGDGGGVWSFVHLDDAASATVLAVEQGDAGIYNVVDSDPAPVSEWLPALAKAVHAKPPRHVPRWLARLVAGDVGVVLMTEVRGASNAKARRDLDWTLRHPSWREGFESAYGR
jgi:nucleoside-diphosphate-sugar epimerase